MPIPPNTLFYNKKIYHSLFVARTWQHFMDLLKHKNPRFTAFLDSNVYIKLAPNGAGPATDVWCSNVVCACVLDTRTKTEEPTVRRSGRRLVLAQETMKSKGTLLKGTSVVSLDTVHSVWTAVHHRICRSTASWSPVLTRGGIYLPYRVSGSTLTAVGRSQMLAWNSLPDFIRDPTSSTDCFRRLLKTSAYLFARY